MAKEVTRDSEPAGPVPSGAAVRVLQGFYEGLEMSVDRDWVVVGRGRGADLIVAEPTMSRAHAAIGFDGSRFFVQDLGSTNGTKVNGVRADRKELASGDQVLLGKLLLEVVLPC
jgi:pSer/pThr/pTyr-binding forkhead associated (FHA) protein